MKAGLSIRELKILNSERVQMMANRVFDQLIAPFEDASGIVQDEIVKNNRLQLEMKVQQNAHRLGKKNLMEKICTLQTNVVQLQQQMKVALAEWNEPHRERTEVNMVEEDIGNDKKLKDTIDYFNTRCKVLEWMIEIKNINSIHRMDTIALNVPDKTAPIHQMELAKKRPSESILLNTETKHTGNNIQKMAAESMPNEDTFDNQLKSPNNNPMKDNNNVDTKKSNSKDAYSKNVNTAFNNNAKVTSSKANSSSMVKGQSVANLKAPEDRYKLNFAYMKKNSTPRKHSTKFGLKICGSPQSPQAPSTGKSTVAKSWVDDGHFFDNQRMKFVFDQRSTEENNRIICNNVGTLDVSQVQSVKRQGRKGTTKQDAMPHDININQMESIKNPLPSTNLPIDASCSSEMILERQNRVNDLIKLIERFTGIRCQEYVKMNSDMVAKCITTSFEKDSHAMENMMNRWKQININVNTATLQESDAEHWRNYYQKELNRQQTQARLFLHWRYRTIVSRLQTKMLDHDIQQSEQYVEQILQLKSKMEDFL